MLPPAGILPGVGGLQGTGLLFQLHGLPGVDCACAGARARACVCKQRMVAAPWVGHKATTYAVCRRTACRCPRAPARPSITARVLLCWIPSSLSAPPSSPFSPHHYCQHHYCHRHHYIIIIHVTGASCGGPLWAECWREEAGRRSQHKAGCSSMRLATSFRTCRGLGWRRSGCVPSFPLPLSPSHSHSPLAPPPYRPNFLSPLPSLLSSPPFFPSRFLSHSPPTASFSFCYRTTAWM